MKIDLIKNGYNDNLVIQNVLEKVNFSMSFVIMWLCATSTLSYEIFNLGIYVYVPIILGMLALTAFGIWHCYRWIAYFLMYDYVFMYYFAKDLDNLAKKILRLLKIKY